MTTVSYLVPCVLFIDSGGGALVMNDTLYHIIFNNSVIPFVRMSNTQVTLSSLVSIHSQGIIICTGRYISADLCFLQQLSIRLHYVLQWGKSSDTLCHYLILFIYLPFNLIFVGMILL